MYKLSCFLCLVLILGVGISAGAKTINIPSDYSTIEDGLKNAKSGDIVDVASGTYPDVGSVVIPEGITLKIQPGAVIKLNQDIGQQ